MKKIYLLFAMTLLSTFFANAQGDVVISQFFGGNSATNPYNQDFVEVFNRSSSSVDVSGWTLQYGSATGSFTISYTFPSSTSIAPGKYYLIGLASSAGGTSIPAPDGTGATNISGSAGKLALAKNNTSLAATNPSGNANVSDYVGYGATANFYEGAAAVSGVSATSFGKRLSEGCTDTNNNSTDFTAVTSTTVRNSSTAANLCSTGPDISITSPSNGAIFSPETTSVNATLFVSNFNVANGTGDGHIHYTINGGSIVMKYDTAPIVIPTTPGGVYTVYVELVDNAHNPITPAQNATITFAVASYTNVNTLAAMRAVGANNWVNFTGEAFVSFTRATRNQKYIQDATAGILIDDNSATISTPFVIGDGISSLRGQLINFNGVLELVPNQNATKPSTGNTITPQLVTASAIAGNIDAYESKLVRMNGVTFTAGDGSAVFAINTDYATTDPNPLIFRTLFSGTEVDYIGTTIPTGPTNFIGIVGENNGVARITARALSELTLSNERFDEITGLKVYPNPAKNTLYITSDNFATKQVELFDVLGKSVLNTKVVNNTVNISSLTKGVYVAKITEEGRTATRKIVVE